MPDLSWLVDLAGVLGFLLSVALLCWEIWKGRTCIAFDNVCLYPGIGKVTLVILCGTIVNRAESPISITSISLLNAGGASVACRTSAEVIATGEHKSNGIVQGTHKKLSTQLPLNLSAKEACDICFSFHLSVEFLKSLHPSLADIQWGRLPTDLEGSANDLVLELRLCTSRRAANILVPVEVRTFEAFDKEFQNSF